MVTAVDYQLHCSPQCKQITILTSVISLVASLGGLGYSSKCDGLFDVSSISSVECLFPLEIYSSRCLERRQAEDVGVFSQSPKPHHKTGMDYIHKMQKCDKKNIFNKVSRVLEFYGLGPGCAVECKYNKIL